MSLENHIARSETLIKVAAAISGANLLGCFIHALPVIVQVLQAASLSVSLFLGGMAMFHRRRVNKMARDLEDEAQD